jgi:hypothetical protein
MVLEDWKKLRPESGLFAPPPPTLWLYVRKVEVKLGD